MPRFASFYDGKLSRQERACLGSFARHGHELSVYSYEPLDLPPGVLGRDAAEILPRDQLFYVEGGVHHGTVTQFSNLFRYVMIEKTGMVWIDSDVICLSSDWPEREWTIGWQDGSFINTAVLGMPRKHPALARAIEVAERLQGVGVWGLTGPHLLTALAHEFDLHGHVQPAEIFYPIHHRKAGWLLHILKPGERLELPARALCVHLWNEVLRTGGHDRQAGPPTGSALEALISYAETV